MTADDWKRRSVCTPTTTISGHCDTTPTVDTHLEILSDLTDETLEGELADEELGRLLVATDLTESDGTRLITVRLLDTTGRWCRLASSLRGELLTWGLATSGFTKGGC